MIVQVKDRNLLDPSAAGKRGEGKHTFCRAATLCGYSGVNQKPKLYSESQKAVGTPRWTQEVYEPKVK